MVSTHCGKRLIRLTPDYPAPAVHRWKCAMCGKKFKQRRRVSREDEELRKHLATML